MHTVISRILLLALVAGCNPDAHDSSTGHAESTGDHAGTAHEETSSTTHAHHSTGEVTTGATGTTDHEHASETGTTHAHTSEPEPETTGGAQTPAEAYCECMVVYCHDDYHGTWGEDHEMSEAMCQAEANALPSVGMPAMAGESIECRMYHCDLAKTDPTACASAIGGGACV